LNSFIATNQLEIIDEFIKPKDIKILKIIGTGSFGTVYLVQSIKSSQYYALKIINKDKIKSQSKKKYAVNERKILSNIQHQFIVSMKLSFETKSYLFLLIEYIPGKDLSAYLDEEGCFSESKARFYL